MKALAILAIKMAGAVTELRRHRSRSVETAQSRQHRRSPPRRQSCPSVRRASQKTNSDVVAIGFTHQSRHQPPHRPRQPHQLRPRRSPSSTAPSNPATGSFSDHARQPPGHIDALSQHNTRRGLVHLIRVCRSLRPRRGSPWRQLLGPDRLDLVTTLTRKRVATASSPTAP